MSLKKEYNMHYLYRHIRLDVDQPFYIGIGTMANKEFKTIKSRYSRANISKAANGKRKSALGYFWKYK